MNHDFTPVCELIARAIITQNGGILANQGTHPQTGQCYYALPGGHVEDGENCVQALQRELQEELMMGCAVGDLQFVIEQTYSGRHEADGPRHELVLYFEARLASPLPNGQAISSPEPAKNFRWIPIAEIGGASFLPPQAASHLQKYFEGHDFPAYIFQNNIASNAD